MKRLFLLFAVLTFGLNAAMSQDYRVGPKPEWVVETQVADNGPMHNDGEVSQLLIDLQYMLGLIALTFITKGWMVYPAIIVYALGGVAGPALQGIMSNEVAGNEQGELQGALTSMMSATAIIGPPIMTGLFAYFTQEGSAIIFPGAPFLIAAVLVLLGLFFSWFTLRKVSS